MTLGWRGVLVRLLTTAATAVELTIPGCEQPPHGLSHDQIEAVMKDRGPSLKSCWNAKGPHGELKLHVAITTTPDGNVDGAAADSKDKTVNACLEKQIKTWTFAKVDQATKFSLPVNFTR